MFKSLVNKITDRGRESQPNSPGRREGEVSDSRQDAEGFLCPKCMHEFLTPEELKNHYASSHDGDGEGAVSDLSTFTSPGFLSIHKEVGEKYKRPDGKSAQESVVPDIEELSDISELKRRLLEALESRMMLLQEKERLEQRAAQLAHDNVTLKAASDEGEGIQLALKERLKVVEAQLAHRESIDDAAVLRQELVQVQRVMDELTREKERERDKLKTELQDLQNFCAAREFTKDNKDQRYSAETQRLDDLEKTLISKDNLITELKESGNTYKKQMEDAETKLEVELSRSQMLEQEKDKLTIALEEYHRMVEESQDQFLQMKEEHDQLKMSVTKLNQTGSNDLQEMTEKLQALELKYDKVLKEREEKENCNKAAQARLDALLKQKDILKSELTHKTQLCEEFENSNTSLQEKLHETDMILSHKVEDILQLKSERDELLTQIKGGEGADIIIQQLSQEKDNLLQELHSLKHHLKDERVTCEKKINRMESILKEKDNTLSDYNKKMKELNGTLHEYELRVGEVETRNANMKQKLEEQGSIADQMNKTITETKIKLQKAHSKEQHLNTELERKSTNCSKLEEEVTRLTSEKRGLEETLRHEKEKLKILEVQRAKLKTSLLDLSSTVEEDKKKVEAKWRKDVETIQLMFEESQVNIGEHEENKLLLLKDKLQLEQDVALLEKTVDDTKKEAIETELQLQQQVASLEKNINETQRRLTEDKTILQNQLSAETNAKGMFEKELTAEKKKTVKLENNIAEQNEAFERERGKKVEELKRVHASLDEIAGEKLALEAQLCTSQTEQKALLERCYASTAESENLRKTIADLRRRLEESQAALHELGRENQTLQLEIEKLVGRKWTEDSDATKCTLCEKEFSLLIRKHHCRNCGQIFCNECSSKMAPITSNKKPVRVCDSCYSELVLK